MQEITYNPKPLQDKSWHQAVLKKAYSTSLCGLYNLENPNTDKSRNNKLPIQCKVESNITLSWTQRNAKVFLTRKLFAIF